jgi:enoyl-CoA hydratase/carnithine racemase
MNFETLELIKSNNIATIKLNRPNVLNAFNEQLMWDLQEATFASWCRQRGKSFNYYWKW